MKTFFAIATFATVLPLVAQDSKTASALGQTLTGAFTCNVSIAPAVPGLPPSFPGAVNFFSDGNVIAQANGDGPAAIEHGTWLRTGDRTFRSVWAGFAQDSKLRYTGPFKVFYNLRLNPDLNTLSGGYRVDFYDLNGAKVFGFSGTAACTRIAVEEFSDVPDAREAN